MSLSVDSKGPDQIVQMCRLIWAFAVPICPKTHFRMARPSKRSIQIYFFSYLCMKTHITDIHCNGCQRNSKEFPQCTFSWRIELHWILTFIMLKLYSDWFFWGASLFAWHDPVREVSKYIFFLIYAWKHILLTFIVMGANLIPRNSHNVHFHRELNCIEF